VRKLRAYCLPWHAHSSPAFNDILVAPLRPWVDLELTVWSKSAPVDFAEPLVFCQVQPPPEILAEPRARIVWLPMWDDARHYSPGWWRTLPRDRVRVAAFARPVAQAAARAGLPMLPLRFHKNPAEFPEANWRNGRVLFYWNRTGLATREFLERLCEELRVDHLIFRAATDPDFAGGAYELPGHLRHAQVTNLSPFLPKSDYGALLRQANLYLAPRLYEGVGLTFLEAMCSGCAVLAHDTPTMNEYIAHGRNGWLFPSICPAPWRERWQRGLRRRWPALVPALQHATALGLRQDWKSLHQADWPALGRAARQDQAIGHQAWLGQLPNFARFMLEW